MRAKGVPIDLFFVVGMVAEQRIYRNAHFPPTSLNRWRSWLLKLTIFGSEWMNLMRNDK
jgi:hypothetical protein